MSLRSAQALRLCLLHAVLIVAGLALAAAKVIAVVYLTITRKDVFGARAAGRLI